MHKTGIYKWLLNYYYKVQSIHTTIGCKGSEKEKKYSFTFSVSLVLRGVSVWSTKSPGGFSPGKQTRHPLY